MMESDDYFWALDASGVLVADNRADVSADGDTDPQTTEWHLSSGNWEPGIRMCVGVDGSARYGFVSIPSTTEGES